MACTRAFLPLLSLLVPCSALARVVEASTDRELRAALPGLRAGDTLRIAAGTYQSGLRISLLHGTAKDRIVIEGADADNPPRFSRGRTGLHIVNCSHLTLRNLEIADQQSNGINIDDGGDYRTPTHHVLLENLRVLRTGRGAGNFDAIKLSGVDDFMVRKCTIEGWSGQAIDMVGCHRGVIEHCIFKGREGFSQTSGPQTKGGSEEIVIRSCRFQDTGGRPLQLGGSTGRAYFRPREAMFEARKITAHDNLIIGGQCAVSFASLDGGEFHHNTIIHPGKWVLRILQENNEPGFPPCRNVEFHHNLILFERGPVRTVANIGANTEPASFRFHHNLWHATDTPARSRPRLPSPELHSHYQLDPMLDSETFLPTAAKARAFGARPSGEESR